MFFEKENLRFRKAWKTKLEGARSESASPQAPSNSPMWARFRKYGAYVTLGMREMTGGWCTIVRDKGYWKLTARWNAVCFTIIVYSVDCFNVF